MLGNKPALKYEFWLHNSHLSSKLIKLQSSFCYNNHFSFTWSNIGMIESICLVLWTALSNSIWNQLICKLTSLTPNNSFLFIRVYPFMILSYSFREWGYFSGLFEAKCLLLPLFAPCCLALDDRCITNERAREQRTSSYTFPCLKTW